MGGKGKHHSRKPNTVRMAYIALALLMVFTIAYSDIFAMGNGNGWHGRGKDETAQFGDSGGGETDAAETESNGNVFGGGSGSGSSETDVAETETKESGLGNGNHGGGATETGNGGSGSGSGSDGLGKDEHGSSGGGSAGGGSEGMLNLTVEVEFVDYNDGTIEPQPDEEVLIRIEKEGEDGEEGFCEEIETVEQTAEFEVPFGGECTISGGPASGYETPDAKTVSLTKIQGKFSLNEKLIYKESYIPVESIELDKDEIFLLKGNTDQVTASVLPANANDQEVAWSSSDEDVATVAGGKVRAAEMGMTTITAAVTAVNVSPAACTVTVGEIISITTPEAITAATGQLIQLPDTVEAIVSVPDGAYINRGPLESSFTTQVAVEWEDADADNTIIYYEKGIKELTGSITGTALEASLTIDVSGENVEPVAGVELEFFQVDVFVDGTVDIGYSTVTPSAAATAAIKWGSSDESIVVIDEVTTEGVTIKGVAPGETWVNAYIESDSGKIVLDTCLVNVAPDYTIVDEHYIVAVQQGTTVGADQFDYPEEVYVWCVGLTTGSTYNLKVEEKGSWEPLTTGTVFASASDMEFQLYAEERVFKEADNYSEEYFLSMSTELSFPHGDYEDGTPKTLVDNFKITSPVPTGNIVVTVMEVIGGIKQSEIIDALNGKDVILCREAKETSVYDTEIDDYETDGSYSDEVKLVGSVTTTGAVEWEEPDELLKIGGYILLIDLPDGYDSNLNGLDPYSDDGSLLKEVHLERDEIVEKKIIVLKN